MTKDELRQEIERLKAEVTRLETLVATLGNGRTNMLRINRPSFSTPVPNSITDPDTFRG